MGGALAVAGGLLQRPREGVLAGLATALLVRDARADALGLERAIRNSEDLAALAPRFGPRVSGFGSWAVDADFARMVAREAEARHGLIVELGSGMSTQLITTILAAKDSGRLISFDHDPHFAGATAAALDPAGAERAEVVVAPLREQVFAETAIEWYDAEAILAALPDEPIELLVVDGPPSFATTAPVRWPAIEVLGPRLAPGAVVLLDDGRRRQERAAATRWAADHPGLRLYWHDTLKGAWRLENAGAPLESNRRPAARRLLRRINPNPSGFGREPIRR